MSVITKNQASGAKDVKELVRDAQWNFKAAQELENAALGRVTLRNIPYILESSRTSPKQVADHKKVMEDAIILYEKAGQEFSKAGDNENALNCFAGAGYLALVKSDEEPPKSSREQYFLARAEQNTVLAMASLSEFEKEYPWLKESLKPVMVDLESNLKIINKRIISVPDMQDIASKVVEIQNFSKARRDQD